MIRKTKINRPECLRIYTHVLFLEMFDSNNSATGNLFCAAAHAE